MKASKNTSALTKKNMNLTAQISDVLCPINKKNSWKSKTSKLIKTTNNKTMNPHPNIMTEDDIDRLFKNHSKDKQDKENRCMQTKVSTQIPEHWGTYERRDFIYSIKFLRVDDEWDKLLTGLPETTDEDKIDALFEGSEQKNDLTLQFKKDYQVGKIIGEGAYASVRIAIYRPLNRRVALKIYEKNKIKDLQRKKSVRREIKILQLLNHPNIVKIYDVVETNNHLNIVMEHLEGISLGSYLKSQNGHKISEKNCKKIFRDLVKALRYMHSLKISHRDIKLQNIILDENLSPKFIDFGFSTCIESKKKFKIFCGTPSYMGPQVVQKKQYRGETADIWALGVLLFVSLTGVFPFKGSTDQELYNKINNADFPKGELIFKKCALDLISKMLNTNHEERITSSQILKHEWFSIDLKSNSKKKNTDQSIRKRINTVQSNKDKDWANKTSKKILAETCKENLHLQIRRAQKSPSCHGHKEIHSYRKSNNSKQNTLKGLRSDKNTYREIVSPGALTKQSKANKKLKQKTLGVKPHSKIINLLKVELKKKDSEKSKSKSKYNKN